MESFLFSLANPSGHTPTKPSLKGTSNQYGIYCNSSYGPTFGGGDLRISNNANENTDSYSELGNTYECPPHATDTFLVGTANFTVNELEVFVFQE